MERELMVSIVCITFNHGKYLRRTLDGFLMQELPYPYEILIHDDASTDDTIAILREYDEKHPGIFTLELEKENQYGKGRSYFLELFLKTRGKYIAICEGDDFWTDPEKLAKQIAVLEAQPQCSACCHNQIVVDDHGEPLPANYQTIYRQDKDIILGKQYLYDHNKFSHTASMVIRAEIFRSMSHEMVCDYLASKGNGDMKWAAMAAACGNIYFMAQDMACYRFVPSGSTSWSSRTAGKNLSLTTYTQLENIQGFIQRSYNVYIDFGGNMLRLWQTAVLTCLKKPNKHNRGIVKQLSKKQHKNVLHMIGFLCCRAATKLLRRSAK